MPKKGSPIATCPTPQLFQKWWQRRANNNAKTIRDAGRAMRTHNWSVTEEEVNRKFGLARKDFTPGQVLAKLQECGIPCGDVGGLKLGWNPKKFGKPAPEPLENKDPLE